MEYIKLSQQVIDGEIDPLKTYIELKKAETEIASAIKSVQDYAIAEAEKYDGKSFKAFGAMVEKKNAACTWKYDGISAYETAKNRLKYVQDIAQAGGGIDPETGEMIEKAYRVEGKSTIAIKIIKE